MSSENTYSADRRPECGDVAPATRWTRPFRCTRPEGHNPQWHAEIDEQGCHATWPLAPTTPDDPGWCDQCKALCSGRHL